MPPGPVQQLLIAFELSLLLMGAYLVFRLTTNAAPRTRWLETNRLAAWSVTGVEFALFVLLIFGSGFIFQAAAQIFLKGYIAASPSRGGLEIFIYGAAFHGGSLLGWLLFPSVRRSLHFDYGARPPPEVAAPKPAWPAPFYQGVGTLLAALPMLIVFNLGWTTLLQKLGLPDEPQDLIAIFASTKSPVVLAGMLVVACGLAPLNEELIFRAGLYRFCRQRLGRNWALIVSGLCFGALHGNWASFLPLAVLGMGLAVAYEATGDIRVTVIAHGLFNLNTIVIVLSGLPQ
ncbi:MAG: CPBP family intramembrane metalloprotease [Lacunisphaera sp.]|nr:CPBP family intramembrane metalloprotease [Lacunisphaera sp.]